MNDQTDRFASYKFVTEDASDFFEHIGAFTNNDPETINPVLEVFNAWKKQVDPTTRRLVRPVQGPSDKPFVSKAHVPVPLHHEKVGEDQPWNMDVYVPLQNLYDNDNQQESKKQFKYTFTDPITGKHTKTMHLIKRQCIAMQ